MSSLIQTRQKLLTNSFNRKPVIVTAQRYFLSTYFTSNGGGNDVSSKSTNTTVPGVFSKGDMIKMIAEEHDLSQAQSGRIINSVFDTMMEEVSNQKKVSISGFGTFQGVDFKERNGRNPSTGEKIVIPARRRVKFSAYKSFKDLVAK